MRYSIGRLIQTGIASVLLVPAISVACTCKNSGQISEDKVIDAMCSADSVFVGKASGPISTSDQPRVLQIDPITVFKGDASKFVFARTSTNCDHWYASNNNYLIFANIGAESKYFSTSICGATRFSGKVESAQFQLSVIEGNLARIDELCGPVESGARQIRIVRQNRDDVEASRAENLHFLKESLKQSRVDDEQALEDARPTRENEE